MNLSALGRTLAFAAMAPLGLAGCDAQTPAEMTVTLLLRTNETDPISGGRLTLIFDGAATTVTTDAKGHASFTAKSALDRRWHWVNVGFTPFSMPLKADHLAFAAQLDHSVRIDGRVVHFPVLYRLDIFRDSNGDCWNPGARVYGRDASGAFSIDLDDPGNKGVPVDGKILRVPNNGYRVTGSFGDPKTEKPLKLELDFVQEHWSQAQ